MAPPTASIVCISYQDLVDFDPETVENHELIEKIGKAFGADPSCLGILAVTGIPNFTQQRETLLPLAAQVANLPDLTTCESPESLYSTGWSHGREQLSPGQPDTAKGSYYANPLTEDLVPALMARENASDTNQNQNNEHRAAYWKEQAELHPAFYAANIWPASLPVLRTAVCDMGRTVHTVGCLLATVCDAYCRAHHVPTALHQILSESLNAKARLLHYFHNEKAADFAASESDQDEKQEDGGDDEKLWCSWHNDHGSLTGLVPAMYLDKEGQVVSACPDEAAGLYIQARSGERVQVRLPPDACGFQIGETSQIQSGGLLQATPHAVLPARGQYDDGRRITREAFAVFLEPEFDAPLAIPEGKTVQDCQAEHANLPASILPVQTRWKSGQTFGDFHVATVTAFATD